jgi:benzoyl-CoA reductase/2-hydroxyglutaryl-CoA dehydratase subunit BcrC/BadD/HgdB
MAGRMQDQEGCTFLFDSEKRRGQNLIELVRKTHADAVVVFMMKFCDPEEFDYPIYKTELEDAGIPILYLEVEQQMDSFEQARTRIQSFGEMLL